MKFLWIPTATLALGLAVSPGVAEEKADVSSQTQASGSVKKVKQVEASSQASGAATAQVEKRTNEIMFGQMMAVQAQLGLHRRNPEGAGEMKASARTQAEALATEAKAVLGADATPQEIREFFRARIAGYNTVAEMNQDIVAVLGPNPNPGTVKAYLTLRRAEIEGLSGREPDFEALRAEVKALGEVRGGAIRGLIREKIKASIERPDAGGKDKDDADTPEHEKSDDQKDEHKLLHVGLKAEHKAWHEDQKEEQQEARQEKLEANLEAKIEVRLNELEANSEARLAKLEARLEEVTAKIEAKIEEVQTKAEARKKDLEAKRAEIEAKAEVHARAGLEARHEKAGAKVEVRQGGGVRIGGPEPSDDGE